MNILIIGATGSLGRAVTQDLLENTAADLTLLSRRADGLPQVNRVETVAGSVMDSQLLAEAVKGQDLVFAALSGDLPAMTEGIVAAMKQAGTKRLVFVTSYGIYGEIAGQPQVNPVLRPYRRAADIVEASGLDYTILRPGWFDNSDDLSYKVTPKGETIDGRDISRKAIAAFVRYLAEHPDAYIRESCGLTR